jgi:hypothetical protein
MAPDQMLRELERLAERLGIVVRFDAFDPRSSLKGGFCRLRGVPLVVLDAHAPTVEKIGVLCDALSRFDVEFFAVPPVLRAKLSRP